MHELAIAESIVKIVTDQLGTLGVSKAVLKVKVKAGRLNAIIPDSLQFHFDTIKKESGQLKDAALEIDQLPLIGRCPSCREDFELTEPAFVCRKCGGFLSLLSSGKELSVESVEVED